jgi:hypothetical protein
MRKLTTVASEPPTGTVSMTSAEAAVYATDLLLELRNMTSAHPRLNFLTYLLEMAFQEAFDVSARIGDKKT